MPDLEGGKGTKHGDSKLYSGKNIFKNLGLLFSAQTGMQVTAHQHMTLLGIVWWLFPPTPFILQISDLLWILSYFPFLPHWPQSIAHSLNFITHSTSKSNHLYFTRTLQNGLYSIVTGKKILKLV